MSVFTICFALSLCGALDGDPAAIQAFVLDSQRAGYERHEFDSYMKVWSDDARIVYGRASKPGKYDLVLNRKQIAETRRFVFQGKPWLLLRFSKIQVKMSDDGEESELHVHSTIRYDGGSKTVAEIYRLRKTEKGWEVYENRVWPKKEIQRGSVTQYVVKIWKLRDQRVEDLRLEEDLGKLAYALSQASRFREAHTVIKKATQKDGGDAANWAMRGFMAHHAGDVADAKYAFKKALSIDPDLNLPEYVRVAVAGDDKPKK